MSYRLAALALALSTVAGCSIPRTGMIAGAATTVAGALLLHDAGSPSDETNVVTEISNAFAETLLGVAVIGVGIGLFGGSAIALAMEPTPAPLEALPTERVAADPVVPVIASEPVALAPPGSATAVLAARREQLTAQIWVESRAGHCGTATAAARRLAVIDRATLIALIDRNPAVASCVTYKM